MCNQTFQNSFEQTDMTDLYSNCTNFCRFEILLYIIVPTRQESVWLDDTNRKLSGSGQVIFERVY
ncbi:hypothetical protein BpHYR1_016108 [Brachionus plicatilis]|uniref:Uncharacterized protein n=1 Tax=Brachionus plicatilis TaxID=10195 RepID=A0A3M7QRE7_BRAPC|nr:hypothetical protein BpHYR1_016108 [Brachionus plicatilis]